VTAKPRPKRPRPGVGTIPPMRLSTLLFGLLAALPAVLPGQDGVLSHVAAHADRFGAMPAVWHSDVGPAARRLVWRGVAEGKTKVVVGARSALFLPYPDLGLIVVDEEHEQAYKKEDGVCYQARDMAVLRGHLANIPVILVSATPSLETLQNVSAGRYATLHLPDRHAALPLQISIPPHRLVVVVKRASHN